MGKSIVKFCQRRNLIFRRILDEFALHEDPRKLFSIAFPGISWGGSLEIFSTHRGSRNYFNELLNEIRHKGNPKKFSLHSVTLQDALDQGLLHKIQSKLPPEDPRQQMDEAEYFDLIRNSCADDESFREEFCCQPCDDNGAFLSYDLISSCEHKLNEPWEWAKGNPGNSENRVNTGKNKTSASTSASMWGATGT